MIRAFCLAMLTAFVLAEPAMAGEIERHRVSSRVLGRELPYLVYVPEGHATTAAKLPVLYLLHGAGGDENAWVDDGHILSTTDKLIAEQAIPPTLIVMPGCRACWWIDGVKDKAETAFWTELEPAVRSRFRTIEGRSGRLIAGLSAGGYGALRYALKYPERFAAAAVLSPAIYADVPPENSSARRQSPFMGVSGFDTATWKTLNYPSLLPAYLAQPLRVPIYLVSGDHDDYGIAFETALAFKQIYARQPALAELRVVDGGHSWAVWSGAIAGAMRYMYRFVPSSVIANAGTTPLAAGRTGNVPQ